MVPSRCETRGVFVRFVVNGRDTKTYSHIDKNCAEKNYKRKESEPVRLLSGLTFLCLEVSQFFLLFFATGMKHFDFLGLLLLQKVNGLEIVLST